MTPRASTLRSARLLAAGLVLVASAALTACGSDAETDAGASSGPSSTVPVATVSVTAPSASSLPPSSPPATLAVVPSTTITTMSATTMPAPTVPATLPPTTMPATTVGDTPSPTTVPETVAPTAPPVTVAPITVVTTDPCALLTTLEVAYAFEGDAQSPTRQADATGTGLTCVWRLDADEATQLQVSLIPSVTADPSTGWPADPSATPVDGLGEVSSITVRENDVRIGFVRGGVTVVVTALVAASTAPTWVDLARQLDARLGGQAALPA